MPGCNPSFRSDKKLDANKIRLLVFFITSKPVATGDRVQATPAHKIELAGLRQADADIHEPVLSLSKGMSPPSRGV
jgi:hypothetical protein